MGDTRPDAAVCRCCEQTYYGSGITDGLCAACTATAAEHMAVVRAFVQHHDNGQAGQPGFPWTYGELNVWQAEWDRLYAALRALAGAEGATG